MGGAHSPSGERVLPQDLAGAWVIDCAGDMPEDYRGTAAWWVTDPFQDYEELPVCWERATVLARSVGSCLRGARADEEQAAAHPEKPPARLYVFCNQGMNRSGLIMGLILRALGLEGEESLRAIASCRPGALTNRTFVRLVQEAEG
jgi:hypothetical protein